MGQNLSPAANRVGNCCVSARFHCLWKTAEQQNHRYDGSSHCLSTLSIMVVVKQCSVKQLAMSALSLSSLYKVPPLYEKWVCIT